MPLPATIEICQKDLFTAEDELKRKYDEITVRRLLRLREMYAWAVANPDAKDRQFVEVLVSRHRISQAAAYSDLAIVKSMIPRIAEASRDYHRWRANEMLLETYQTAKKRKDTKTMERAASSYAKYNRVDIEDERAMPYDRIVVQPFTAEHFARVIRRMEAVGIRRRHPLCRGASSPEMVREADYRAG